jgi:hypothetical protein
MSQDMYSRLTRFFRPFNNLLSKLTGLNVTHWNTKAPPQKLPKFSPLNETMPELWFEIKEAATKKSHFLPQLLPQRWALPRSCTLFAIALAILPLTQCHALAIHPL